MNTHQKQAQPPENAQQIFSKQYLSFIPFCLLIFFQLVQVLEPKKIAKATCLILEKTTIDGTADNALWMEEVFSVIGVESKTTQLLKTVHQGIILPTASQLKVIMFSATNQITKDSRDANGWTISIKITDTEISTTHSRKEVSMLPGKDSFQFEWRLSVYLCQDFQSVTGISLKADNLICDPKFDENLQLKLRNSLEELGKQ